jgi:rhodanese-related sulfurtransferase
MFNSKNHTDYTNISVEEFKALMHKENVCVLDVRTNAECAEYSIPGAVLEMDFYNGDFESKFPELDIDKTYLLYCRSGVRSAHACEMMAAKGFKHLYNLRGGILAWLNTEV